MITFAVISCLTLVVLSPGCATVDPRLQSEYLRTDIEPEIRSVFDKYKHSIPEMMKENKIPSLSVAVVDRAEVDSSQ